VLFRSPGGGSLDPEPDPSAQGALFVVEGELRLEVAGKVHQIRAGGFAWLAPASRWTLRNTGAGLAKFHWIRKAYEPLRGVPAPESFVSSDQTVAPAFMPDVNGVWATTRFIDPDDIRFDMHVNIVTFQPGGVIPFAETHIMEHGLYVLEGKAVYRLNQDWVEVEAGDFMWLRAFCPQACYAGGPGPFRYLLYKDVNRHPALGPVVRSGAGR
jgi:(S)-ureidoglycine aminohydrolase